jgi:hypothetical protein
MRSRAIAFGSRIVRGSRRGQTVNRQGANKSRDGRDRVTDSSHWDRWHPGGVGGSFGRQPRIFRRPVSAWSVLAWWACQGSSQRDTPGSAWDLAGAEGVSGVMLITNL